MVVVEKEDIEIKKKTKIGVADVLHKISYVEAFNADMIFIDKGNGNLVVIKDRTGKFSRRKIKKWITEDEE
jgi:hypothetical protein